MILDPIRVTVIRCTPESIPLLVSGCGVPSFDSLKLVGPVELVGEGWRGGQPARLSTASRPVRSIVHKSIGLLRLQIQPQMDIIVGRVIAIAAVPRCGASRA